MRIQINGEVREAPDNSSLQDLVAFLDLPSKRLAIELNRAVVKRADWPETMIKEDDHVEIVQFVGGGSESKVQSPVR